MKVVLAAGDVISEWPLGAQFVPLELRRKLSDELEKLRVPVYDDRVFTAIGAQFRGRSLVRNLYWFATTSTSVSKSSIVAALKSVGCTNIKYVGMAKNSYIFNWSETTGQKK